MRKRNTCSCGKRTQLGRLICSACRAADFRKRYPMKYSYVTLRDNSKRRGIDFSLSFDEFAQFAVVTDYFYKKGKTKRSYSIDRINPEFGYHIDNIQPLPLVANQKKSRLDSYYDYNCRKMVFSMRGIVDTSNNSICPF